MPLQHQIYHLTSVHDAMEFQACGAHIWCWPDQGFEPEF